MARKETVNTFTDGLISDLNPINTPNTVLTDCLNGTLITYDGNEYSLQNDKGNFPLKDCKLQENYIPVGVKEYGDILYIVSYNPITKHVQIGSYPSPETIFDKYDVEIQGGDSSVANYDNNLSYQIDSLWSLLSSNLEMRSTDVRDAYKENYSSTSNSYNYSELTEKLEELKLFYGAPPENYKLNPGDKYKLTIKESAANNAHYINDLSLPFALPTFEGVEFYIFDENRKPYDITKDVEINTQNHIYTSWKVPGYMGTKLRFGQLDDFKVNVRKIIVPTYTITGASAVKELSLNFQFFISDYLYNNNLSSSQSALKVQIQIFDQNGRKSSSSPYGVEICESLSVVDLKNGTYCYYVNWTLPNNYSFNSNDTIELIITPFVENGNQKVFYDKFQRTLKFDLSQKGSVNDFEIGEGIWRYTVDNQLTLYFDTSGIQETSVMSEDVALQYKIKRASELANSSAIEAWVDDTSSSDWHLIYDWNVVGDTILKIDLDPWHGSIETANDHYYLYAEDYYYITFKFINPEAASNNNVLRKGLKKTILATELLNGNESKKYDKIYFDEWINNYPEHIKNKYVNVSAQIDSNNQSTFIERSGYYDKWVANGEITEYPTFKSLNDIDVTTDPNPDFTVTGGINFNTTVTYTSDLQLPVGPLWQGLSSAINYNDHTQKSIIPTTGLVDTTTTTTDSQVNRLEKKLRYLLRNNSIINSLFNFEEKDLSVPASGSEITITAEGIYENQVVLDAGPDPDLRVKVSGTTIATFINDTSSYFNSVTSYLLNKFNTYDILFITIKMDPQTIGDDTTPNNNTQNYNSLRFKTGEEFFTSGDTIYAAASDLTGSETYFAVFKIKDTSSGKFKLLFIPVGEITTTGSGRRLVVTSSLSQSVTYNRFKGWIQNIKHLKGDGVQVIGGFYQAIESKSDINTPVINIETSPYLSFSQWLFLGKNMFSESDRNTISNSDNFFRTSTYASNNVLLSGIQFDTQNTEITYSGDTTELDSLLETEKLSISTRNTQVSEEILDASSDTYLNQYKNNPDVDLFVGAVELSRDDALLVKFLNKEQTSDTAIMFVTSDHWNPPKHNGVNYGNNEYSQYNYMGVTEVGLVINPTT